MGRTFMAGAFYLRQGDPRDLDEFCKSLLPDASFVILDDLGSLCIFSCFSVIQVYIAGSIIRHWKARLSEKPARTVRVFWIVNLALCFGYLVCTSLAIAGFAMKLELATRHTAWSDEVWVYKCPEGFVSFYMYHCVKKASSFRVRIVVVLQTLNAAIAHFLFIVSDMLLVYRCYLMLETPRIITGLTTLPLLGSLAIVLYLLVHYSDAMSEYYSSRLALGLYLSLGTNVMVSTVLIVRLWRGRQEFKSLVGGAVVGEAQIPYSRLMKVLLESALPPLILGVVHVTLYFMLPDVSLSMHSALWISFTVGGCEDLAARQEILTQVVSIGSRPPKDHTTCCTEQKAAAKYPNAGADTNDPDCIYIGNVRPEYWQCK
ncbi:hypothetical protein BKA70DRAFT_1562644 [Coprinopsis sp. MPI-PUGE-AT-0042]|nr:hypothetical protein BKA70DRAFT_1562644 [Coprinopsis sp. MPI-PUGE-AT-0042]